MTKLITINLHMVLMEGIKSVLNSQNNIELIATGKIHELEQLVSTYRIDTVLLQCERLNIYEIEMIRSMRENYPSTHFLVISDSFTISTLKKLIRVGVIGFTQQQISPEELIQAISSVGKGQAYVPLYISELILPDYKESLNIHGTNTFIQLEIRKPFHLLTPKECIVIQLLAEGKSNNLIAETMKISDKTVKNHVSSILLKMEVKDRTQAVIKSIKNGWVDLNNNL